MELATGQASAARLSGATGRGRPNNDVERPGRRRAVRTEDTGLDGNAAVELSDPGARTCARAGTCFAVRAPQRWGPHGRPGQRYPAGRS
jgi:hypothetical protein